MSFVSSTALDAQTKINTRILFSSFVWMFKRKLNQLTLLMSNCCGLQAEISMVSIPPYTTSNTTLAKARKHSSTMTHCSFIQMSR